MSDTSKNNFYSTNLCFGIFWDDTIIRAKTDGLNAWFNCDRMDFLWIIRFFCFFSLSLSTFELKLEKETLWEKELCCFCESVLNRSEEEANQISMAFEDRCSPQSAPSPPGIPHSPQKTAIVLVTNGNDSQNIYHNGYVWQNCINNIHFHSIQLHCQHTHTGAICMARNWFEFFISLFW